jgi:quinol monooxygenase YgiN
MAPTTQPQLTLFVTFHIHASKISDWKAAHRPVWAACAAEPECILFDVFHDPANPGVFRLVEVWSESREWFETKQLTKPYYETLWEKSRPTWEQEVEIEYFERLGEGGSFKGTYLEGMQRMG